MKLRKILTLALSAVMATGLLTSVSFGQTGTGQQWDVSKSKTATQLDKDFISDVTLSLPAAEEQLVSDVVLVLDKSTSAALEEQALAMLRELKGQVEETNAKVKVGVVIFNKEAHVTDFKDLATEYDAIEAAVKQDISSGTNTHAGLLAGKEMLDNDTDVDDSRKYLIFVSDGITYMYDSEPTATAWSFMADAVNDWAGPDNWASKYGSNEAPDNWAAWMEETGAQVEAQGTEYEYPYDDYEELKAAGSLNATPVDSSADYANSVDKALWLTYQTYQQCAESYNCYAMTAGSSSGEQYLWGPSFMEYLSGGEDVSFDSIKNDIYYLLDAGSKVIDEMGYGTDNAGNSYDFDFVDETPVLTVGGIQIEGVESTAADGATSSYIFGDKGDGEPRFMLDYYRDGYTEETGGETYGECFVLTVNEPVSQFSPVQLTYSVKLMDPSTEPGTYGQYDADGSEGLSGLYTNNQAVLLPVATGGAVGEAELFPMPTVSYTVEKTGGTQPGDTGDADTDADNGSKGSGTKTGDDFNMLAFVGAALAAAAAAGATVLIRRRKTD